MPMTRDLPDAELAGRVALLAVGVEPVSVRRFETGMRHFVFDVGFADRPPVVVRMAGPDGRDAMAGALNLSNALRPLGVPLPEIHSADLEHRFPFLILERLPGRDLMHVVRDLSVGATEIVARNVAEAQRIVAGCESAGRFGYAVMASDAPHETWSQVLLAHIALVRQRIADGRLFDVSHADAVKHLVHENRAALDRQKAIPFLHDTTTKNVIVDNSGGFSGIVDVDDLCFGDPRYAVALTLASLTSMRAPTAYVDCWMAAAGFSADRIFHLYALLFIADFMSEQGQVFNGNVRDSSVEERSWLEETFAGFLRLAG
jgi:aminoglycoside phosphotransferase (APT) family kinase protein